MSTELYTCREVGKSFRITKFDGDLNVLSTYLTTERECDCPRGTAPTCRHRQKILPAFKREKHTNDGWFFNFDTRQWSPPIIEIQSPDEPMPLADQAREGTASPSAPAAIKAETSSTSAGSDPAAGVSITRNWKRKI